MSRRAAIAGRGAESRTRAAIAVLIALHAGLCAWLGLARYASVHNRTFDLALYARMTWGLGHAQPWDPIVGGNFLGGHMPWVLLPLALLARVASTVPVLICAQSLAVALAAWPLSAFAMRRFGAAGALVAALVWLLQPNLGHVASYEFHPGSLALWPMCIALDAFDREQPRRFLFANLVVLGCRVSLALQTFPLALLALRAAPGLGRAARVIALASFGYFALSQFVLQPHFGQAAQSAADLHFGKWGGSPLGVLPALWRNPRLVLEHLSAPERLRYPLLVLAPFAFLPLLSPRHLLVALPPLALNLLSAFPTAPQLYSHYLTPALPALAFGALEGLARVVARAPGRVPLGIGLGLLGLAALSANVLASGLPWALDFEPKAFVADANTSHARAVLRAIGSSASVQAPDPLLPHLAERVLVSRVPPPDRGTDFIVFDVSHRRRYARQETLLRTTEEPIVRAFMARPGLAAVGLYGDFLVLERHAPAPASLARRYVVGRAEPSSGDPLCACLAVRAAVLRALDLELDLVAREACPSDLALRFGAEQAPRRVDLLFDGLLSPAHLVRGDRLRSVHRLSATERAAMLRSGVHLGVLRSSGARPRPNDPQTIALPVHVEL